jgi:hypothetical protein
MKCQIELEVADLAENANAMACHKSASLADRFGIDP